VIDATQADKSTTIIRSYLQKNLSFHVQSGATIPLCNDTAVESWLSHPDDGVVDATVHGIADSDIVAFARWLQEKKKHWPAARLYNTLASKSRTATEQMKVQCWREALVTLQQVPSDAEAGVLDFDARLHVCLLLYGDREDEKDSCGGKKQYAV
jgi:hypothetical protein